MRCTVLILLVFQISHAIVAQEVLEKRTMNVNDFKEGVYVTDEDLDRFIGTWEWSQNQDTYRIYLEKRTKKHLQVFNAYMDQVEGLHTLIVGGVILENSTNWTYPSITGGGTGGGAHHLGFRFHDISKDKHSSATLELLDPTGRVRVGSQARFQVSDRGKFIINGMDGNKPFHAGFTVPTDVIMTKVE
ncbi:MAG: hypothetical protein RIF46_17150 [Cyclobacteriaceae bacterium]